VATNKVKEWFEGLPQDKKDIVDEADVRATAAAASVKGMLLQARLIEPTASDGQIIDTLKMRHD
jgi:hypothetical protein